MSWLTGWSMGSKTCENCGVRPKKTPYEYCSKECSNEADLKRRAVADAKFKLASGLPARNEEDDMCDQCRKQPKNRQRDPFTGKVVIHPFCSRSCAEANAKARAEMSRQIQRQAVQSSAGSGLNAIKILDSKDPRAEQAATRFMERWSGEEDAPEVRAVFKIYAGQRYVHRHLDLLDFSPGCQTTYSYYGGQCLCEVGVETLDTCDWKGCSICLAIKTSFDRLEFGTDAYEGLYGPGLYTNLNPAHAHKFTVGKSTHDIRSIVQCRVAYYDDQMGKQPEGANTAIVDQTGAVFCEKGNKAAILPTYLIVYKYSLPAKPEQPSDQDPL